MPLSIGAGDRLPQVKLGRIGGGEVRTATTEQIFGHGRAIIVGVPGAFTPVCTRSHIPRFVELAPSLLVSGFDAIACLAANDPWTMGAWAREVDPEGRLQFYSDGNLEFGKAMGLVTHAPEWFLGQCLQRFVMVTHHGVVERISVEHSPMEVTCSSADHCIPAARAVAP